MAIPWFDRQAMTFQATNPTNYVNSKAQLTKGYAVDDSIASGYAPRQAGILSLLGKSLTGIAAPFVGDTQWLQNETAQQLRQQQADQEFQALLMKNAMEKQAMVSKGQAMKPVYTMGLDGKLIKVDDIEDNGQVVANPNAPTADMRNQQVTTGQAKELWNEVKSQSEGLKGGYAGMFEMGKAALNRGKGESGNYQLYTENLPSSAVGLYRALTGDTRLSDADAKARALPLLWEPSQDVSLRTKKNEFIDKMINSRERLLSSGKYKDGVIPLSDLQKATKEESSGQIFNVGGKSYNIPADKIEAFKKAKGIK